MRPFYLALAALYMAGIFWLSAQPGSVVGLAPPWDKLAHLLEYAGLGWLLRRGLGHPGWAVAIAAAYGVSDELHQSVVPGREASLMDGLADLAGAFFGAFFRRP